MIPTVDLFSKSCNVNFHVGRSNLPRPFRSPDFEPVFDSEEKMGTKAGSQKRHYYDDSIDSVPCEPGKCVNALYSMRNQRKLYKHVRLTLGSEVPLFLKLTSRLASSPRLPPLEDSRTGAADSAPIEPLTFQQSVLAIRRNPHLFQRIVDIVAGELAPPPSSAAGNNDITNIPLLDLGMDSLTSLEFIVKVEDDLGLSLEEFFWGIDRQRPGEKDTSGRCLAHLLDPLEI